MKKLISAGSFNYLILILIISTSEMIYAQEVGIGQKVKITSSSYEYGIVTGTYLGSNNNYYKIESSGLIHSISTSEIDEMWVSNGSRSNVLKGMGHGLLTGSLIGGLAGLATYSSCEESPGFGGGCGMFSSKRDHVTLSVISGALLGTIGGGIIGAFSRTEKWEKLGLNFEITSKPILISDRLHPMVGFRIKLL